MYDFRCIYKDEFFFFLKVIARRTLFFPLFTFFSLQFERALQSSIAEGELLYKEFVAQAKAHGWNIAGTLLNPKDNRIRMVPAI